MNTGAAFALAVRSRGRYTANSARVGVAMTSKHAVLFFDTYKSTDKCRVLEELLATSAPVADFYQRIQKLAEKALGHNQFSKYKNALNVEGDGGLCLFDRVEEAYCFTKSLHEIMETESQGNLDSTRLLMRVGISHGDITEYDGLKPNQAGGLTVNHTKRLEGQAVPGGTCISHNAWHLLSDEHKREFGEMQTRGPLQFHLSSYPVPPPRGDLHEILETMILSMFELHEIQRLVRFLGPDGKDVVQSLPDVSVGMKRWTHAAVEALDNRGLIDEEFFKRILHERPKRASEINDARYAWGIAFRSARPRESD